MKIEFFTNEFEFSHGRMPRGRGSWAFEFPDDKAPWFARDPHDNCYSLLYVDAKKFARAEAKRRFGGSNLRSLDVKVLP